MAELLESTRSAGTDTFDIEGTEGRPEITRTFKDVWGTKKFSDFTFEAKGGSFKVHKLLLSAYCTKLTDEDLESSTYKLQVQSNILQMVLTFIYTNKVSVPKDDLKAVAEAAKVLGVTALYKHCISAHLKTSPVAITSENALQMWMEAREAEEEEISEEALTIALKQFVRIQKSEGFKALPPEYLKMYVCDPNLAARTPDERLASALVWIRVDTRRNHHLKNLLDLLPLSKMSAWYLDHLLEDTVVKQQPHIVQRILDAQQCLTDSDRRKTDDSALTSKEKCLVFIGAEIEGHFSSEVYAVQLEKNYKVVKLGSIDSTFKGYTSCCVYQGTLYSTGVGDNQDQVWRFHLDTRESSQCCRLINPIYCHAMTAGSDGNIYTLAGCKGGTLTTLYSVEVYDTSSGHCSQADGQLKYSGCSWCSGCWVDGKIVVAATSDTEGYSQILVWDPVRSATMHTLRLQDKSYSDAYGVTVCQCHVIIIADEYTAVGSTQDILAGRADKIKLCTNYVSPNYRCGVTTSPDDQSVLLIGGWPKSGKPQQYIYECRLSDLVQNTATGWIPVNNTDWSLGECQLYGSDVAYLKF